MIDHFEFNKEEDVVIRVSRSSYENDEEWKEITNRLGMPSYIDSFVMEATSKRVVFEN